MKRKREYRVELYELHVFPVVVLAADPIEAAQLAVEGKIEHQDVPDDWESFVRYADECGISVDDLIARFPELGSRRRDKKLASLAPNGFLRAVHDIEEV